MNNAQITGGIGISGLCFLWGIVTQCLNWAGVLHWSWYACWGPTICIIALWCIALLITLLIAIIAVVVRRR